VQWLDYHRLEDHQAFAGGLLMQKSGDIEPTLPSSPALMTSAWAILASV